MVSQTPVGIRTSWSSLVFAVTNRLDAIDAALLRPGCLEEHVLLSHPNSSSIHEILKIHTAKMPVENSDNLAKLSKMLEVSTASCAEIKGMCRVSPSGDVQRKECLTTWQSQIQTLTRLYAE